MNEDVRAAEAPSRLSWIGEHVRDASTRSAYSAVEGAADWSGWMPFAQSVSAAPRLPGVYLFRERDSQLIRYVGMAGERAGSGRPQGLYGRLRVYRTGKAAVSGFGEAALDRALADVDWLEQRTEMVRREGPQRAKLWAAAAVERIAPEVSLAVCSEPHDARLLEDRVVLLLRPHELWNR